MRRLVGFVVVGLVAGGCGLLPGGGGDETVVTFPEPTLSPITPTPIEFPTAEPTPTPTPRPTAVPLPTPTELPTPTPTPVVEDAYATFLGQMRAVFSAEDKVEAIGALVPIPVDLLIPADADLQELQVGFGRWDVWERITGRFPPIDTPAYVTLNLSLETSTGVDELRDFYATAFEGAGFEEAENNSRDGQFSEIAYELNGGLLSRGRDGAGNVNALRQGDTTFLLLQVALELNSDSEPGLVDWPSIFEVPFPGDFYQFGAVAVDGTDGISVSSTADWIIRAQLSNLEGAVETLSGAYPTSEVTLGDGDVAVVQGGNSATVTFEHRNGTEGTIQLSVSTDGTTISVRAVSLPG